MKKDSSTSNVVLIIFLIVGFFLALLAFSPLPSQSFSWKKIWGSTGLEKEEEARRELIEQRKKMATKMLREKLQAIEHDRQTLMENRKELKAQAKDSLQQSNDPQQLREKEQLRAQTVEQQKETLIDNQQKEQERQRELKANQDNQLMNMRDRMDDLKNRINTR